MVAVALAALSVILAGCGPTAPAATPRTSTVGPAAPAPPTTAPTAAEAPSPTAAPSPTTLPVAAATATRAPATATSVAPTAPTAALYPVTDVVDGDTVKLRIDGRIETVRAIGIDTPETVDPRTPVQCFGREASTRAKALLTGKDVRIEHASFAQRRTLVELLIDRVVVDGEDVEIRYVIPLSGAARRKRVLRPRYRAGQ